MDTIKALLQIKKKFNVSQKEALSDSKLLLFEKILMENENATDEEICHLLYGNCRKTSTYRTIKFRVEEKLMNEVFLLSSNISHDNNYSLKTILAAKNYTIALSLHKYGFADEAISLFTKNLNYCNKYSLTNIALLNIKPLYYHFAFVNPNVNRMNKMLNESERLMHVFECEKKIEHYNAIISHLYVLNKGGMNKNQLSNVAAMVQNIIEIKNTVSSRNIDILSYDLICFYYMLTGEFESCIKTAKEGLAKAEGNQQFDQLFKHTCFSNLALSNFHLANYGLAEKWFLKAMAVLPKGSRKLFHDSAKYFVVLVRQKSYEKLVPLYLEIIQYKSIKKYEFIYETWLIIEAIIHFLIDLGKIKSSKQELAKLPKFSVNKFINSVPFFSKDKKGQYITIHIIKILFLLQKSKFDQIVNLSDSLNQYTYKYLKNDETLRSNCFIKMILKMVKVNFHPERTKNHVKPLYNRLTLSKIIIDERSSEVEIIPYEVLWEYIMEIIKQGKRQ